MGPKSHTTQFWPLLYKGLLFAAATLIKVLGDAMLSRAGDKNILEISRVFHVLNTSCSSGRDNRILEVFS